MGDRVESNSIDKGSKIMMIILGIVMATVLGGLVGYMLGKGMEPDTMKMDSKSASTSTLRSVDAHLLFDGLFRQHVTTNLLVTRNVIDGAGQDKIQSSMVMQNVNIDAIANAIGGVYGDAVKSAVKASFIEHLTNSNKYAQAVATDNKVAEAQALTSLQVSLHKIADVFHSFIPTLTLDALYSMLNAHEIIMNQVAEEYKAGNFKRAYELESRSLQQTSESTRTLVKAIVDSNPYMFK